MVVHEAFENAGQETGLEIWRIEDFEPVPYPKKDYGKFFTGDSYIILATREKRGRIVWDLHFWLGNETSQDESGAAALLTVQLDDHLSGAPVQYREVQNHESQLFLSHFKNGIRYAPGGVSSGFQHADTSVETRLFQVKGKKNIRVRELQDISINSLNKGDCFIIDSEDGIFVYVGPTSKRLERLKAITCANMIRDQDHGGRPEVFVIDEFSDDEETSKFFELLGGGSQDDVPDEDSDIEDDAFENEEEQSLTLYRISDADGNLDITEVASKPLEQSMLDSNVSDCFILSGSGSGIFVWIGRDCSPGERSEAMSRAQKFLTEKSGLPPHTRIQRIVEGAEPTAFQQCFTEWQEEDESDQIRATYHCQVKARSGRLVTKEIFDVEQDDLDQGDVMIVVTDKVVYVWFGKDSSADERELSTAKAEKLKLSSQQDIVTMEQGDETSEFCQLFDSWDPEYWQTAPSYQERKVKLFS